jgi:hypothetical protein
MPGPEIPESNHVSRLCGASKCDDGQPLGAAFMLKPGELYLSTNWLEYTGGPSRADQLTVIRQHLTNKGMRLPVNGRLAMFHLQTMIDHVQSNTPDARRLTAHHEPILPYDPSHSGVYGYTVDDQLIADLIAQTVQEVYTARG